MTPDTIAISVITAALIGASFFGLFKLAGTLVGRNAARKYKATIKHLEETIKDPVKLNVILDGMKKANELLMGESGESKMNWVIGRALPVITKLIPGDADDQAVRDFFQGVYDGYKDEIAKG